MQLAESGHKVFRIFKRRDQLFEMRDLLDAEQRGDPRRLAQIALRGKDAIAFGRDAQNRLRALADLPPLAQLGYHPAQLLALRKSQRGQPDGDAGQNDDDQGFGADPEIEPDHENDGKHDRRNSSEGSVCGGQFGHRIAQKDGTSV
ncbi:MAG: hypothetical protein KGI97_05695 [Alphaproteobacteria bacterium]|nr:hypothetical protein [Alphaproteobacteria bacterium]